MDDISWLAAALVSLPEEFLFVIITCLIIGKRDFFKDKGNTFRTILASVVTTIAVVVIKRYSPYFLVNVTFLQLLCFIVAYTFILKIQWHKATLGILLMLTSYAIVELVDAAILFRATGVTMDQCLANDLYRIVYSLPARMLQGVIVLILYKLPFTLIDYGVIERFTKGIAKRITVMIGSVAIALIAATITVKHFIFASSSTKASLIDLSYVVFAIIALLVVLVVVILKFSEDIKKQRDENLFLLLWMVTLCETYPGDTVKIKEIVKKTIGDGGNKDEE